MILRGSVREISQPMQVMIVNNIDLLSMTYIIFIIFGSSQPYHTILLGKHVKIPGFYPITLVVQFILNLLKDD